MKTPPFKTALKNLHVFIATAVLVALWYFDFLPSMLRAIVQVPMFLFIILSAYLLLRSLFCRSTTDTLGDDAVALGKAWDSLPAGERVKLLIYERVGFVIAGAIIVAGILIIYGGVSGAAAAAP